MKDDGAGAKAYYHEMRKRFRLILLLSVQDGGNGRDYLCGLNEADFMFLIRMSDDGVGASIFSLGDEETRMSHFIVVCAGF